MGLGVFFAHDTPPSAQAQTTDVWSATLTVQAVSSKLLGCYAPKPGNNANTDYLCSDHLTTHTFTHNSETYEFEHVLLSSVGERQSLSVTVSRPPSEDWVLVVGGDTWLSLRDAKIHEIRDKGRERVPHTRRQILWTGTDFNWAAGNSVALKLVTPATNTPTVSLSASPNPVLEGDPVTVTATLSAAASSAMTIPVFIRDLSAEADDHGSLASIAISNGETTGTGTITTAEDVNACTANGRATAEACEDETFEVFLKPGLPAGVLSGDSKTVKINIIDDDVPLPRVSLSAGPGNVLNEGEEGYVRVRMSRVVYGDVSIPLTYTPGTAEPADYSGPVSLTITRPPTDANRGVITIPEDGDSGDGEEWEDFTVSINASALPNWLTAGSFEGNGGWGTSYEFTIHDTTPASGQHQAGGQNSPCDNCGTGGDTGAVAQGQGKYADLIAQMKEWRNDPEWSHQKAHTDRWDRALLAFGETVDDATLTPMTAAEAQGFADRGWERWVEVAEALWELQNKSPTVSSAIADVTIVNESGTKEVSLAGVFDDADGDSLTITAASSDEATATASVSSDGSSLTVTARLRGTATITVTADDGKGGTAEDSFTVTVKAAPLVAQPLDDVSGLEMETTQEVSLVGVFSDADGDQLTITAASSDETKATVAVASDGASLTLAGVAEGTAAVTVTAEDSDGNRVSDAFDVEVVKRFASLIPRMYQWRNDPQWAHHKPHTDRWDRALLAFGETVADATLTPMTAAQAQALADQSWGTRWVPVAAALWQIEGGGQQETPNAAPTVSAAISDATIVNPARYPRGIP